MSSAAAIMRSLLADGAGQVGARVVPRRLGVAVTPRRGLGAPAEMIASAQAAQQPVQYSPAQYNAGDVTYLGFGRFTAASTPGLMTMQTTQIVRPDRPFVPQKLFLPSTQFGGYLLAVLIEGTNILASQRGIAWEMYSEASYFPQMDWPTIDPSTGIEFQYANPSGVALDFAPAFYGTDVRR